MGPSKKERALRLEFRALGSCTGPPVCPQTLPRPHPTGQPDGLHFPSPRPLPCGFPPSSGDVPEGSPVCGVPENQGDFLFLAFPGSIAAESMMTLFILKVTC